MQIGSVTTPFGRRSMTLGMLASQVQAREIEPGKVTDKWKLFRAVCEGRLLLGVSDRALAVLNALLSFYPGNTLSEEAGLIVFPSNTQLSIRAHGMAPATLRRHLAALVEAGLLVRKDSPNGKRYARRDRNGDPGEVFGFSVGPLLSRAREIYASAAQVNADKEALRVEKEQLSICRRDISKMIETALEEGVSGDWTSINTHFRTLVAAVPRTAGVTDISPILNEMKMLRDEIVILLETRINTKKIDANESHFDRHIQNSNTESNSELEPASTKKQDETSVDSNEPANWGGPTDPNQADKRKRKLALVTLSHSGSTSDALKSFPLGLVLQSCPEIAMYGPGGVVSSWRELMAAAVTVRSMLGVSPSAYEDACVVMGPENAATVMACVLERSGSISSAGGYLRDLTRRAERGEFAIGPMLLSLARSNSITKASAG